MRALNVFSARVRGLLRREAVVQDIDDELRLYLEMETAANISKGMAPAEASRAARRSFGNFDKIRERAYEVRGGGMAETLLQDVRYGARVLAKNRSFTAVAVLTLALGIGANTAIFSVVNELLLRPLPYPGAERIALVWEVAPDGRHQNLVSPANYFGWREQSTSFEGMAAFSEQRFNLSGGGAEPEEVAVQLATPELFGVLGARPALGRGMAPGDAAEGAPRVAFLSYGFWQRRFGGDPQVVGKSLMLNGRQRTVAGVMPAGFQWYIRHSSTTGRPADLWVPMGLPTTEPGSRGRFLSVVGRLKPGVSLEKARSEMATIAARLENDSRYNKGYTNEVIPLREQLVGEVRSALLILLGAVGCVLLIACANVSNLLLARAAAREKEIALRTALGAHRSRIVRQLLTESLLLAVLGCLAGLVLAWWGVKALVAISPRDLVNLQGIGLNLPVLAVTVAVSLATGILFGLVPALEATRLNLNDSLKEGGKGTGGQSTRSRKLRSGLVVAEVALALVLLAGAGLLVKSFVRLQTIDTGFKADKVLTMVVRLPDGKYPEDAKMVAFYRQATEHLRALPGVRAVGTVNYLPLYGGLAASTGFTIEGRPAPEPGQEPGTNVRVADAGYFGAMGIPLLRGRTFTDDETREPRRVVIISALLAKRNFPGEDPIGKRISVEMFDKPTPTEIVGVVGDARYDSLVNEAEPTVYFPPPDLTYPFMTFVLRTAGDPTALISAARGEIRALDPNQAVSDVRTMHQVVADMTSRARFNTLLLGLFAGLATLLAAVGIFGVMSYSVVQRTREIGLRVALGAPQGQVLRLILKQGLLLTLIGIGLGLAGALALTRVLSGLLYGVGSTDPSTFAAIVLLLTLVAFIACYIPARRAARVDPLIALRYD